METRLLRIAAVAPLCAACSGAPRAEPVTIVVEAAKGAEVVIAEAASAAPSAAAAPKEDRAAAITRALIELDEPPQGAIRSGSGGGLARIGAAQPGPKAVVTIGGVGVSGGAVANAAVVTAGMAAGMRRCVNRELSANPASVQTSNIKLTASIGPNGEVLSVTPAGGAGLPNALIACLLVRVTISQFAPPDTGSATLMIPVTIDVM